MPAQALYLTCIGLACPVGLTPESAAAAMRCAIDAFVELRFMDDNREPIIGAVVPALPVEVRGTARLVELLALAGQDSERRVPLSLRIDELPLLLCTREPERPGVRLGGIVPAVEARLGRAFRRDGSGHTARAQGSVFDALSRARELVLDGYAGCLIAAVDSLIDARPLLALEQANRLKTIARSDGVIPGEAAGFLLVTAAPPEGSHIVVKGLGFGVEQATILNEEPLLGLGMAAAVRDALAEAGLEMEEIDFRLSDVAGESYAFEELVLAQTRLMRRVRDSQPLWHPASAIGDSGAAAGLVQLAWAEQAFARGYAPGRRAVCHASAATGARAAAVIEGGEIKA